VLFPEVLPRIIEQDRLACLWISYRVSGEFSAFFPGHTERGKRSGYHEVAVVFARRIACE